MRMMVVGPRPPLRGGIAAHTVALEKQLALRGHEILRVGFSRLYPPVLFPGRSETVCDSAEDSVGAEELRVDAVNPLTWPAAERAVAASRSDRVVLQWWHPFFSRLTKRLVAAAGAPVVSVCHNAKPHDPYPGWQRATARALGSADMLLCHSQAVSDAVGHLLPQHPRRVIAMPALLPSAGTIGRVEARRQLGIRPGGRLALFAGHVRPYKGLDVLLAAWDRAHLPGLAGLVLAGESYLGSGRLQASVARRRRAESIRVIDRYLPDARLAAWLAAADVLVLPYLSASQSGLLDAGIASGTAIIATDVGGLGEQARRAGALMVEPGAVDQLAGALSEALARVPGAGGDDALRQSSAASLRRSVDLAVACESACRRE